jgi:CxxC motif-containing protein (DUF1111 family)
MGVSSLKKLYAAIVIAGVTLVPIARAQEITRLGGDATSDLPPSVALELPAPNIGSEKLSQRHIEAHAEFHSSFEGRTVKGRSVLGPFFNHNSCGGCHFKNSRGPVSFSSSAEGSPMLVKVGLRGLNPDGSPRNVPGVGEQLQDHTSDGKVRFKIRLRFRTERGSYPDGTPYTLRRPLLRFSVPNVDSKRIVTSLRMTPPVIGMGLLEAIPAYKIYSLVDPADRNRDGISGRASFVPDLQTGKSSLGRFGWRATHPTLKQQTAAAFAHDMGMTNELFREGDGTFEVSSELLDQIRFYQQAAGVTPARDQSNRDVVAGKSIFQRINCSGCHTMTFVTGASTYPGVANQVIHPFTDLLLHDMGVGLKDNRPEFSASGKEWRTPPLWGIGLTETLTLSKKRIGFLHDGRARTIEEAILWHGGEAQRSRDAFKSLRRKEREQLIMFLRSL